MATHLEAYTLGLDLGSNSLGWAIVSTIDGEPHRLIRAGVRIFEAGMEGEMSSGREESRNLKRRQMRSQRRQTWRRARRLAKIFNTLRRFGLLPQDPASSPAERQDLINRLDADIRCTPWFAEKGESGRYPEPSQTLPYILRAEALREKIEPHFLGRALYHLAQRRGFLSNRKRLPKNTDDEEGKVNEGIAEIRKLMAEAQAPTLGDYFARLSPFHRRIRQRWTHRDMYESEFEAIWSEQSRHRPKTLTLSAKKELRRAIFFQRPLWFDRNTIGRCEFEPPEPRAPMHLLISQRFRLLDKANNLLINGTPLTPRDREKLLNHLELHGDLTFPKLRKLLGLAKDDEINLARGGEEKLIGNRTFHKFHEALGQRWLDMTPLERDRLVEYVFSFQKSDKLAPAAQRKWQLDRESAQRLADIVVEPDRLSLSIKAIEKFLPLLETGLALAEARKRLGQDSGPAPALDVLPSVDRSLRDIRNPAVARSLTELRKVVNAIVREYGKPTLIRIELARDLRKSKSERQKLTDRSRDNERSRKEAAKMILDEVGMSRPSREDILKALLWKECGGICPYTGKSIPFKNLFGRESQFDIEHIVPYDRCFDDSFANLTLCEVHENRHVKGRRTPWEAYGSTAGYDEILDRVKRFNSPSARPKLWRFQMKEAEAAEFVSRFLDRQLNDTRYASRLAMKYLGMLFGGVIDQNHNRRIQATSGQVTAQLRRSWGLNGILNDGPTTAGGEKIKTRDDHRHHAVDAIAIALTDSARIQELSRAASLAHDSGRRKPAAIANPLGDTIRPEIEKIVVSHRVSKKASGALHEETFYSAPAPDGKVSVRKPLAALTRNEVDEIVDPVVREMVRVKLGESDPKKVFANLESLPRFVAQNGRLVVIKRVRLRKSKPTSLIGAGRSARHVASESNHHIEIFAERSAAGNERRWDGEVVSMRDAVDRTKNRQAVVRTDHSELAAFKFSLAPGEVVERADNGMRSFWVVRSISQLTAGSIQIGLVQINDARKKEAIVASKQFLRPGPNVLRLWGVRKVAVSPLGDVSEAHD